jgi:hypothetical protein
VYHRYVLRTYYFLPVLTDRGLDEPMSWMYPYPRRFCRRIRLLLLLFVARRPVASWQPRAPVRVQQTTMKQKGIESSSLAGSLLNCQDIVTSTNNKYKPASAVVSFALNNRNHDTVLQRQTMTPSQCMSMCSDRSQFQKPQEAWESKR